MKIGIDVGSTTVKVVCLNDLNQICYKVYKRHLSKVEDTLVDILQAMQAKLALSDVQVSITGSAGIDMAKRAGVSFTQEVVAATLAVKRFLPPVDAVIEIGGEDVKVIFFDQVIDQRMNSSCAGGTGAFIDQMATLLDVSLETLNDMANRHSRIYPIASRCGVFAKTDIQALINQGASREDIAASVFQAVVNQTIAGLAQGRTFKGKICFLGGPLTFFSALRERFIKTLKLTEDAVIHPADAEYYIALGCASFAGAQATLAFDDFLSAIKRKSDLLTHTKRLSALFKDRAQKEQFLARHHRQSVIDIPLKDYHDHIYIGIDAGSTTTKVVVIGEKAELLYSHYSYNQGSVIDSVRRRLIEILKTKSNRARVKACAVTGYGEALIQAAFALDFGEVETIAHFEAAKHFMPEVDFIIDIGGQDMKCLKIKNGYIESIVLNEACSSGCGSFISTFANALGYNVAEFADLALNSRAPVDLGSRCTIFMNSSVKQAQKEGAGVEDISAGLAISVVKNALYKVLRMNHVSELGNHIVVQGGTFYNDAILRAFERETGGRCVRPSIAGLMGAFGAALIAQKRQANDKASSILALVDIENLQVEQRTLQCKRCTNHCQMTLSQFSSGAKYISGNRCELGLGISQKSDTVNMYAYKNQQLNRLNTADYPTLIGMPFVLNNYENRPFWVAFFDALKIGVVFSDASTRHTYESGQHTIPSDTACYPAKIVHGHIEWLIDQGCNKLFYPSIVYNFKEKDYPKNHYNCPVVASYPEVIQNNVERLQNVAYVNPYLTLNDVKPFTKVMQSALPKLGIARTKREIRSAYLRGITAYQAQRQTAIDYALSALKRAMQENKRIIVLCGRPYHLDPEINHGIDELIISLGAVVLTEDSIAHLSDHQNSRVLNQWTYHTRLYDAAKYVAESDYPYLQLVHLVSFGCGLDAITSDEVSRILEQSGKLYTQIKIDEMSNLGAVKIRLRSLLATMEDNY